MTGNQDCQIGGTIIRAVVMQLGSANSAGVARLEIGFHQRTTATGRAFQAQSTQDRRLEGPLGIGCLVHGATDRAPLIISHRDTLPCVRLSQIIANFCDGNSRLLRLKITRPQNAASELNRSRR